MSWWGNCWNALGIYTINRIVGDTTDECPPDTAQVEARRFRIVAENPATQLPTAQVSRSTVVVVGVDGDEKVCRPARGAEERNAGPPCTLR